MSELTLEEVARDRDLKAWAVQDLLEQAVELAKMRDRPDRRKLAKLVRDAVVLSEPVGESWVTDEGLNKILALFKEADKGCANTGTKVTS